MARSSETVPADEGLASRRVTLGLRSPIKLYDGPRNGVVNIGPRFIELIRADARAGHAAVVGRRELRKVTAGRPNQPIQTDAEDKSASYYGPGSQHCQVEGVLQPNNKGQAFPSRAERTHNMAVLAIERRLAQLNEELNESRELKDKHKQQLNKVEAAYKQKLKEAEGAVRAKLKAMQLRAAEQLIHQRQLKLLSTCASTWFSHVKRCKQLKLNLRQIQLFRMLKYWEPWRRRTLARRRGASKTLRLQATALHAWQGYTHHQAVNKQKLRRIQLLRMRHTLSSWWQYITDRQQRAHHIWRARIWHRKRMLWCSFRRWHSIPQARLHKAEELAGMFIERQARLALKVWHVQASAAVAQREEAEKQPALAVLRQALQRWQEYVVLQVQCSYLQHRYQQHLLQQTWQCWVQLPAIRKQQQQAESAFAAVYKQLMKQWGLQAFKQHAQECHARERLAEREMCRCMSRWRVLAATNARSKRLLAARAASKHQQTLLKQFSQWHQLSTASAKRKAISHAKKLQEMLSQQEAAVTCAEAQAKRAAEQLQLLVAHNHCIQQEATAACAGALADLQFAPTLQWRSLPFSPGEASLQPRARHAVLRLEALQPTAQQIAGCSAAVPAAAEHGSVLAPARVDVLLVYGGVTSSSWLTDLEMLVLQEYPNGDYKLSVSMVSCSSPGSANGSTTAAAAQGNADCHGSDAQQDQQLPIAVRDFAACACGHNQFVVAGGFDGNQQTLDLQLCVMTHSNQLPEAQAGAGHAAGHQPTNGSSSQGCNLQSWCQGYQASWQVLQPRNRTPVGRCHHTVSHYTEGRSLVVFGGWTNREGCLNDVWLFHQDHLEWWQPETVGAEVPVHRRSHAAVLLGHKLFIYGGIDGHGQHLDDLWCLDMKKWEWQRAATKECLQPAARRAASLELVGDRHLLLHGGYCGTEQLLHDTWVFDTWGNRWLLVDVSAPASELPVPRALHTLTRIGHRFVVIGGQGACGPVPDVQLLESPAVTHGLQLQRQWLEAQQQLVHSRERCAELDAELACCVAMLQESSRQLQDSKAASTRVTSQQTALQQECSLLQDKLLAAQQAASSTAAEAHQAQQQVVALQRRLVRARDGGSKAVEVAREKAEQLQAADRHVLELQQQLQQCQRRLQQQQLSLSERHAEVAVLQSELQDCRTRLHVTATASDSAQTDYRAALSRSNKLYAQELRHLQELLQDARKAQKQLAEELAALQAQPPPPATAPAATDAQTSARTTLSDPDDQPLTANSGLTPPAAVGGGLPQQLSSAFTSQRVSAADDGVSLGPDAEGIWQDVFGRGGVGGYDKSASAAGSMMCLTADQVAVLASRQGKTQAELELMQQKLQVQQEELSQLRQQLRLEQQACTDARQSQQLAVQELQLEEERHQQQVAALEQQLRHYRQQLWEATAITGVKPGALTSTRARSEPQLHRLHQPGKHSSSALYHDEQAIAEPPDAVLPAAEATVSQDFPNQHTAADPDGAQAEQQPSGVDSTGLRTAPNAAASCGGDSTQPDFGVHLVATGPADGDLELLPEVIKLLEVHQKLMTSA